MTIHDINFMYEKKGQKLHRAIDRFQNKLRRIDHACFISKYAREDTMRHFHMDLPNKVIYNGATDLTGECGQRPSRFRDLPDHFFFHISSLRPKKNVELLVDMMQHMPKEHLVIAGDWKGEYGKMLQQKIAHLPTQNIHTLPQVSEKEKAWLYSACKAFLFPSLCEGFGLPPIEAMHFGKPVFLSRLTSLPETGGEQAYYWDSLLPQDMARVVRDKLLRAIDHKAIKEHARQFDWDKCADEYINYYLEILES